MSYTDTLIQDAAGNVAQRMADADEVGELIDELYAAAPGLLSLLGKQPFGWADYEMSRFMQRLRAVQRSVEQEADRLVEQSAADAADARDYARESQREFDRERAA